MTSTSIRNLLCLGFCCLLLGACERGDSLSRIADSGKLTVVSRNGPTTYYLEKGEPAGFEYALAQEFARDLGVKLRFRSEYNSDDVLLAIRRGQADLAAAGLTVTPAREQEFSFSRPYQSIQPHFIYRAGLQKPRELADLARTELVVAAKRNHIDTLNFLKELEPALAWTEVDTADAADLMELVSSGEADYALVDSNEFNANLSFYPRLRVGFSLEREDKLAWLFPAGEDSVRLRERADTFLERVQNDGTLALLREKHFGYAWGANPVGTQTFNRNVERKLPKYEALIRQVAQEYQMDWHLLAAIAYQESHWNPRARSPTGVRGMMMLTNNTAREMGVQNRLDPLQSLRGGARYFKKLKRRMPDDITEPDRTWFALAAYNIGRGHLEDARVITEREGGDPHLWSDLRKYLPLLQRSKYYSNTRHGYARGSEPVTYVKNIRHYRGILAWRDINRNQPLPPIDTDQYVPYMLKTSTFPAL
jgi:membrane-bound lytic murein transglycosylase F